MPDIWRIVPISNRKKEKHLAVMPDDIVQIVLDSLPEKPNLCYDPFGGTGTTMKVCKKNDIKCIISEINKEYEEIINQKINM